MEARLIALENRLGNVLLDKTAEAAQQTVGPQPTGGGGGGGSERTPGLPSLVDKKAIGKPRR